MDLKFTSLRKAKTLIEAEKSKGKRPKHKPHFMDEYETYLRSLRRGKSLLLTLSDHDKFPTVRYRFQSAARSLGIKNLRIERAGSKVVVYREVKPRAKRSTRPQATAPEITVQEVPLHISNQNEVASFDEVAEDELIRQASADKSAQGLGADEFLEDVEVTTGHGLQYKDVSEDKLPHPERHVEEEAEVKPWEQDSSGEQWDFITDEESQEIMLRGRKTCEARLDKYPEKDFFAFGDEYVITKVELLPLADIAQEWFREHGCYSAKEFREIWKSRHRGVFDPEQKAWLHHFRKAFEATTQVETEGHR